MPREKVESVNRALNILKIIGKAKPFGFSAADLQRRTEIPKSSLSYILRTLVKSKFLNFDRVTGRYTVGTEIVSLGAEVLKDIRQAWEDMGVPRPEVFRAEVVRSLQKIAQQTKLVALCGVFHRENLLFIESYEPTVPFIKTILPGERWAPYELAFGKILMSYVNEHQFYRIMRRYPVNEPEVEKYLNRYYRNKELLNAKTMGYAIDGMDGQRNIRSVASPLLSAHSDAIAAIGVIGTVEQINDFRLIGNLIKAEAQSLSVQLRTEKGLDVKFAVSVLSPSPVEINIGEETKTRVEELQKQLRHLRREKRVTQKELASKVGVSQSLIAKIESGNVNNIDIRTLIAIVLALENKINIQIKS